MVTAVPAHHGPPGTEDLTGPVTGFVVAGDDVPTTYVSGDNAATASTSCERSRTVPGPFDVAVLFAGGAKTALLGDAYLTLSSAMAARATAILGCPHVVVVHTDGWSHFTQGAATLATAFARAGVAHALHTEVPGRTIHLDPHQP